MARAGEQMGSHGDPAPALVTGDGWAVSPDGSRRWGVFGAAGLFLVARSGGELGEPGEPKVLMQHRAPWTNRGGTWALPGGALDVNETPEQGALRETFEETGIDISRVEIAGTVVTSRLEVSEAITRQPVTSADEPLFDAARAAASEHDNEGIVPHNPAVRAMREHLSEHPVHHPEHGWNGIIGLDGNFWWEAPSDRFTEWAYTVVVGLSDEPLPFAATAESLDLQWCPLSSIDDLPLMPEFRASLPELTEFVAALDT